MNTIKRIILGVFILLILAVAVFFILRETYMLPKKYTSNLSEVIQLENIDDLRLTIYYINPSILTSMPVSVDDLINWRIVGTNGEVYNEVNKIVVNGSELTEHIDLLSQLSNTTVIIVANKTYMDARLYYVFENKRNNMKFDVATSGDGYNMFVNGVEVENNDIFYYVVMPFISEEDAQEFLDYLK